MLKCAPAYLLALAMTALFLTGFFKAYPVEMFAGAEQTIVLDPAMCPIKHRAGFSYYADLSRLKLDDRADNANAPPEMQVQFFENGVPLANDNDHSHIETRPGLYSHWDHTIVFSPSCGVADSVYSIRLLQLDESRRFLGVIASPAFWFWTAVIALLALAAAGVFSPRWRAVAASSGLLIGLMAGVVPHVVKYWGRALTMPDSEYYVRNSGRPPLYPWLIRACKAGATWSDKDLHIVNRPLPSPSSALLAVIRAQRLLFWANFLFAAWAAALLLGRPLAVLLFLALHLGGMLLPEFECSLMSEALAEAFLFLVVAAFCVAAARRCLWSLPLLGGAYGCLVLTRSAGVFAIVLVVVAVLVVAAVNWRRKLALAKTLGLTALVGLAALGALLGNSFARNGVWALSPLRNCERVAFALQCADASDLDALPDEDARRFLDEALRRKSERLASVGKSDAKLEDFDLNLNCWQIAFPLAREMFVERFGSDHPPPPSAQGPGLFSFVDGLFSRVANVVLVRHRDRYARIVAHSFLARAVGDCTRLRWKSFSFLWLAALGFVGCVIGRNVWALAGATCLAAHLGNLAIISCFEMPLTRYVYFSEWICLLGFALAGIGCARRMVGLTAARVRAWSERAAPRASIRRAFAAGSARLPLLALRAASACPAALERALAHRLRGLISLGLLAVLTATVIWHTIALLAQPLMLYPDSADFMGRAYCGLLGDKVWRGDYQFLPGYPYILYWLSRLFAWPINTPLRLVQHGCLVASHLCAYGVVRTLTRSQTFAVIVALSGLTNLGFTVLGNQLISEPVYSALVSGTALSLCAYAVRPRPWLLVLAGLTIGLASLVRATGVYMAWLPVLLVAATVWQSRRRTEWPRPGRQILALAGCLGLVALCVAPVLYYNRTRMNYWGLTHYLGINLYARVIEYDKAVDPEAPAQRQILEWWEQRRARTGEADTDKPAWRSHWSCTHLAMEEGGLNQAQADDLLRQAALEGIRTEPLGYARRTVKNLVDVLAADYRLYCYTLQDPPPAEYPRDYYSSGQAPIFAPYHFNKASIGSPMAARCYCTIDCYEPFGASSVARLWGHVVGASLGTYGGVAWEQRLRWWAWLVIGGALVSLVLRPRLGWWMLFGMLSLHIGGAVAVEWPLPRYRLPFDMLLTVYPWLCMSGTVILLQYIAKRIKAGRTVKAPPLPRSTARAA